MIDYKIFSLWNLILQVNKWAINSWKLYSRYMWCLIMLKGFQITSHFMAHCINSTICGTWKQMSLYPAMVYLDQYFFSKVRTPSDYWHITFPLFLLSIYVFQLLCVRVCACKYLVIHFEAAHTYNRGLTEIWRQVCVCIVSCACARACVCAHANIW